MPIYSVASVEVEFGGRTKPKVYAPVAAAPVDIREADHVLKIIPVLESMYVPGVIS